MPKRLDSDEEDDSKSKKQINFIEDKYRGHVSLQGLERARGVKIASIFTVFM